MLRHCRVIDATDDRALLAGRILADLGADVVQLEPTAGAAARVLHPRRGEDDSYVWRALTAGKRTMRLDTGADPGRRSLLELCADADILIASRTDPTGDGLDGAIDLELVRRACPDLICVVLTPFGANGPKAELPATDLTIWAAGGPLDLLRDGPDRPPLRISAPQAWLHAGADAAVGAVLAYLARRRYGAAQLVDVSAQASVAAATLSWSLGARVGETISRPGGGIDVRRPDQIGGAATTGAQRRWPCVDGMIDLNLTMSPAAGGFTNRFFAWMAEEGACDGRMRSWDWREMRAAVTAGTVDAADIERARKRVAEFLATKTKREVLDAAVERKLTCVPVYDIGDVARDDHLRARDFWSEIETGEGTTTVPGRLARVTGAPGPVAGDGALEHRQGRATVDSGAAASGEVLEGLRVLDLSWVVAGPMIGRTLADFGATVVRVESSTHIETARTTAPFVDGEAGPENSALYGNCNAGKLGLTLDLSTPAGRDVVRDLAGWADVVIESFAPGRLAAWGLDYDALHEGHDDLIMLSTSMMGQTGPRAKLAGYGSLGASLSGFQGLAGWPDRDPIGPFGPYTDFLGPRLSLAALLAALVHRERNGEGCYVDGALVEAGAYFLAPELAAWFDAGQIARADGNADPDHVIQGVYPCRSADGRERYIAIAAADDAQATRLGEVLAAAAGDVEIAALTAERDAERLQRELWDVGVPCHLVADGEDLAADPQLRHRGHFVELPHPIHGETTVEAPRYLMSATPGRPRSAAPLLGEHNRSALKTLLDYDDARLDQLEAEGVLR